MTEETLIETAWGTRLRISPDDQWEANTRPDSVTDEFATDWIRIRGLCLHIISGVNEGYDTSFKLFLSPEKVNELILHFTQVQYYEKARYRSDMRINHLNIGAVHIGNPDAGYIWLFTQENKPDTFYFKMKKTVTEEYVEVMLTKFDVENMLRFLVINKLRHNIYANSE